MNNSINNTINFRANLIISSPKIFSTKINCQEVSESFKNNTKNLIKDLYIRNAGNGFGICANIIDEHINLTNLTFNEINDENTLVDKLIRIYKMLITKKILLHMKKNNKNKDISHYKNYLSELAGSDKDLKKKIDLLYL